MGTPVPIVEVLTDGKYQLNEELLKSIVSKANGCQKLAVIAIIGSKQKFFLNFLISYLESQDKIDWPLNCKFLNDVWHCTEHEKNLSVNMWSEPLVLIDNEQQANTAVFLMDSNSILKEDKPLNTKLFEDITNLFCLTASTIVFINDRQISEINLETFKHCVEKSFNENFRFEPFQELLHLVFDWEPETDNSKNSYLFGFEGGKHYLKNEFKVDFSLYFEQNRCYLLPSGCVNADNGIHLMNNFENKFVFEITKLITSYILNVDEIQIKKCKDDDNCIEAKEFVSLFKETVELLNGIQPKIVEQIDEFDPRINGTIDRKDRSATSSESIEVINEDLMTNSIFNDIQSDEEPDNHDQEQTDFIIINNPIEPEQSYSYENLDTDEEQAGLSDMISRLKADHLNQLISYLDAKKFITEKDLKTQHLVYKNQMHSVLETEIYNQNQEIANKVLENNLEINYDYVKKEMDHRKDVGVADTLNYLISYFCDKIKTELDRHLLSEENLCQLFVKYRDEVYLHLENSVDINDTILFTNIHIKLKDELDKLENDFKQSRNEVFITKLKEYSDISVQEYYQMMETLTSETKFNSNEEIQQIFSGRTEYVLEIFDRNFNKNQEPIDIINPFRDQLSSKLADINNEFKSVLNLRKRLENQLQESVNDYIFQMKESIETKIESQMSDILNLKITEKDLDNYHNRCKNTVKQNRNNLFTESSLKRFEGLLSEKQNNFEEIRSTAENYLNDWKKRFSSNRFIEDLDNCNQQFVQRRKTLLSLKNQEVKTYSLELFDQIFTGIKVFNQRIINEMKEKYENLLKDCLDLYEKNMRKSLQKILKYGSSDTDLMASHNKECLETLEIFRKKSQMFASNKTLNSKEFTTKLDKIMNTKKNKYKSSLDQINKYKIEWMSKFNVNRFISSEKLIEINRNMIKNIIKTDDNQLDQIIFGQLNEIFKELTEKFEQIKQNEENIADRVVETIVVFFNQIFINKLKSDFYNTKDIELLFNKLYGYTEKCFIKRFNFTENQQYLIETNLDQLKSHLNTHLKKAIAEHSQNSLRVKDLMKQSVRSSEQLYKNGVQQLIGSGLSRTEFLNKSNSIKTSVLNRNSQMLSISEYFNQTFYQKLLSENQNKINCILKDCEKQFLELFENKPSKEISMAIYFGRYNIYSAIDEQDLSRHNGIDIRANCVAVEDKVMVGSEARDYYLRGGKPMYENFDIKSLLDQTSGDVLTRTSIPLKINQRNKVNVKLESKTVEISIESLIALQVLEIRREFERRLKTTVRSAVLTVPTYFDIKQRNSIKTAAKIAGIDSVNILTDITAAAISYAKDIKPIERSVSTNVLFISINDNKCHSVICEFKDNQIRYKCNNPYEFNFVDMDYIRQSRSDPDNHYNQLKNIFRLIFDNSLIRNTQLKNIVVIGSSLLIEDLKIFINSSKKFNEKILWKSDTIDVIVKGTAIYNKTNCFKIYEVSVYPISYRISSKTKKIQEKQFIDSNYRLPMSETIELGLNPSYESFPFTIDIFQNKKLVDTYRIKPLNKEFYETNPGTFYFQLSIDMTATGLLNIQSGIINDHGKYFEFTVEHLTGEFSPGFIKEQERLIRKLMPKVDNRLNRRQINITEPKQTQIPNSYQFSGINAEPENLMLKLKMIYQDIKLKFENNTSFKPFIKNNIQTELDEVRNVIESGNSSKQIIETYIKALKKLKDIPN